MPIPSAKEPLSHDPLLNETIAGRYVIERMIGRGGVGLVYLALDREKDNRNVVVKVLAPHWAEDADAVARFDREAERMSRLEHPNVVKMFAAGKHRGAAYIVMEFLDGEPLRQHLNRVKRLSFEAFIPIASQILAGVGYVHARDTMLRDIKPANIMLCERDGKASHVKLLDFGLAKLTQEDREITKGHVIGTAGYLSPEQIKGEAVDVRVDVYALGILFFILLTGESPIIGDNDGAILFNHVHGTPKRLTEVLPEGHGVPDAVIELVHQCLAREPDDRPQDANEIAEILFETVHPSLFMLPTATEQTRKPARDFWAARMARGARAVSLDEDEASGLHTRPVVKRTLAEVRQAAKVTPEARSTPPQPPANMPKGLTRRTAARPPPPPPPRKPKGAGTRPAIPVAKAAETMTGMPLMGGSAPFPVSEEIREKRTLLGIGGAAVPRSAPQVVQSPVEPNARPRRSTRAPTIGTAVLKASAPRRGGPPPDSAELPTTRVSSEEARRMALTPPPRSGTQRPSTQPPPQQQMQAPVQPGPPPAAPHRSAASPASGATMVPGAPIPGATLAPNDSAVALPSAPVAANAAPDVLRRGQTLPPAGPKPSTVVGLEAIPDASPSKAGFSALLIGGGVAALAAGIVTAWLFLGGDTNDKPEEPAKIVAAEVVPDDEPARPDEPAVVDDAPRVIQVGRPSDPPADGGADPTPDGAAGNPEGAPDIPVELASLSVEGPVGARLFVDGEETGTLPFEGEVPVGDHTLRVTSPGLERWDSPVAVQAGETTKVVATLKRRKGGKKRSRPDDTPPATEAPPKAGDPPKKPKNDNVFMSGTDKKGSGGIFLPVGK